MTLHEKIKARGPLYQVLLVVSLLFACAAIVTLLPNPGARYANILGYKSVCAFVPGSTLICALAAGINCALRARLVKKTASPIFIPVMVIAMIVGFFVWSLSTWISVEASYAQATSSATVQQE